MKASHSVRVNLRFGPRTDPALLQEILTLPPYKRARLLRQLLAQGWQQRQSPPPKSVASRPTAVQAGEPNSGDGANFSQDILSLLGQSVRR